MTRPGTIISYARTSGAKKIIAMDEEYDPSQPPSGDKGSDNEELDGPPDLSPPHTNENDTQNESEDEEFQASASALSAPEAPFLDRRESSDWEQTAVNPGTNKWAELKPMPIVHDLKSSEDGDESSSSKEEEEEEILNVNIYEEEDEPTGAIVQESGPLTPTDTGEVEGDKPAVSVPATIRRGRRIATDSPGKSGLGHGHDADQESSREPAIKAPPKKRRQVSPPTPTVNAEGLPLKPDGSINYVAIACQKWFEPDPGYPITDDED